MPFSDPRTPPPAWAAGQSSEPVVPGAELAQVFSFDTRQRVPAHDPTVKAAPRRETTGPDPHEWARQIVLRLLTGSAKSRAQLEQALQRRNCDPEVAAAVLDRLQEVGLVDDTVYAQNLVRTQQANRGLAGRALAAHLRSKGVQDETVQLVLDDLDPEAEVERARELVRKKLRSLHGLDPQVQMRRLAGMLARKGYPSELSMRVIREAIAGAAEHQRD